MNRLDEIRERLDGLQKGFYGHAVERQDVTYLLAELEATEKRYQALVEAAKIISVFSKPPELMRNIATLRAALAALR